MILVNFYAQVDSLSAIDTYLPMYSISCNSPRTLLYTYMRVLIEFRAKTRVWCEFISILHTGKIVGKLKKILRFQATNEQNSAPSIIHQNGNITFKSIINITSNRHNKHPFQAWNLYRPVFACPGEGLGGPPLISMYLLCSFFSIHLHEKDSPRYNGLD